MTSNRVDSQRRPEKPSRPDTYRRIDPYAATDGSGRVDNYRKPMIPRPGKRSPQEQEQRPAGPRRRTPASVSLSAITSRNEVRQHIASSENVVVYRSPLSEWRKIALFLLSCVLVNMAAYSFPATLWPMKFGAMFGIQFGVLVPLLGVLPLIVLLYTVHQLYDERYVISPDSVMKVTGLLSLTTRTSKVYYQNVRGTDTEQGPAERLFGVGDLRISVIATDTGDIILRGVRNPPQYKGMLERRMMYQHRLGNGRHTTQ